jgi:hypothetical protein
MAAILGKADAPQASSRTCSQRADL